MKYQSSEAEAKIKQILDAPMYSIGEVGRLTGLHPSRVTRWLQGYTYEYEVYPGRVKRGEQGPVVRGLLERGTPYASFLDLIDLLFVKQFLDHRLSLQKVRAALDEATRLLGTHHFARETFFTDGHGIYLKLVEARADKGEGILQLMTGGQWTIAPIILELAKRIDFHQATGFAHRWYPLGRDGLVVIDPFVSFGRPSVVDRGVTTENIYNFYLGEARQIEQVSRWMALEPTQVRAAVDFEQQMAA